MLYTFWSFLCTNLISSDTLKSAVFPFFNCVFLFTPVWTLGFTSVLLVHEFDRNWNFYCKIIINNKIIWMYIKWYSCISIFCYIFYMSNGEDQRKLYKLAVNSNPQFPLLQVLDKEMQCPVYFLTSVRAKESELKINIIKPKHGNNNTM